MASGFCRTAGKFAATPKMLYGNELALARMFLSSSSFVVPSHRIEYKLLSSHTHFTIPKYYYVYIFYFIFIFSLLLSVGKGYGLRMKGAMVGFGGLMGRWGGGEGVRGECLR